ncbi:hypothetical protein [Streptomyces vastus]|uniref:Uncharacterized protein n=1 Tax=Streptomyces vastus TaxID=285451 RepID=A0ABP6D2G0_9ACTN
MSKDSNDRGRPRLLISVFDDDPLRARSDARELLTQVSEADPTASLRCPQPAPLRAPTKAATSWGSSVWP